MKAAVGHWAELMKASLELVSTGVRTNEMLTASGTVIASRMGSMAGAVRNPWGDDHVELGRMVPEKVSAFTDAGNALWAHWSGLLREVVQHGSEVSSLMFKGRLGDPAEFAQQASASAALATAVLTNSLKASSVALAPIHKQATSNAKRLSVA